MDASDENSSDTNMKGKFGFLKNFAVNITATGAAAVLIAWLMALVAISIWGNPTTNGSAFILLSLFGGLLFVALGQKLK